MLFRSRTGTLPRPLAHIHTRYRTPDFAIFTTTVIGTVLTAWLGMRYGPQTAFALVGSIVTILIMVFYQATCLSVPFFYYREHRKEFRVIRHLLLPLGPAAALIFPIWAQFVPAPAPPLNLAGPICGLWILLGLTIVGLLRKRAPETLSVSGRLALDE